jgi:hypothetical protein
MPQLAGFGLHVRDVLTCALKDVLSRLTTYLYKGPRTALVLWCGALKYLQIFSAQEHPTLHVALAIHVRNINTRPSSAYPLAKSSEYSLTRAGVGAPIGETKECHRPVDA